MQWMNYEDCQHQSIDCYLTDVASELVFTTTPDYLKVGNEIEKNRYIASEIIE